MSSLDWSIVVGLNVGVIAYGFYLARGTSTSGEWFLGSRALPWWAVGLSMFATNIDNADLVSLSGTAYNEGMHIIVVHTLGSALGVVLAAFYVVPPMCRAGFYTNAEYLEARFGPTTRVLSALIQIQYRTSMLGLMIWSVYLLLTGLVGLEPRGAWALVVTLVVLAGIYTAWGGLKSVVLTDALQGIVMMVGAVVIFSAVWNAVGGWAGMQAGLETAAAHVGERQAGLDHIRSYRGDAGITSPYVIVLGWLIIGGSYWTVNHTQTMRLMGSRSLWDMKMAAIFGAALSMPIMVACASLGVFGRALLPDFHSPDQIYPFLASRYLGPGLQGLVVAGILAAAVSSFDSMGSALSAVFTRDIYARLVKRHAGDAHYVWVSRCATVGILVLGFLYLPFIRSKDTMLKAFLTLIPVFVTPLFTIYLAGVFTRAHRRSGLIGLIAGSLYGVVALYDRETLDVAGLAPWFTGRWEALGWSMVITSVAMAVTTRVLGRQPIDETQVARASDWLERSRKELPPLREHPFACQVPRFLNPGWIAVVLLLLSAYLVFGVFW